MKTEARLLSLALPDLNQLARNTSFYCTGRILFHVPKKKTKAEKSLRVDGKASEQQLGLRIFRSFRGVEEERFLQLSTKASSCTQLPLA